MARPRHDAKILQEYGEKEMYIFQKFNKQMRQYYIAIWKTSKKVPPSVFRDNYRVSTSIHYASFTEIAKALGVSQPLVSSIYHSAMFKIHAYLNENPHLQESILSTLNDLREKTDPFNNGNF